MKLSRNTTLKIHYVLDQLLPPVVRDSGLFMSIPFRMLFGKKARHFKTFKNEGHSLSAKEYRKRYEQVADVMIERATDLNNECLEAIHENLTGKTVLDVGCGRGLLADSMSARHTVTGTDMIVPAEVREQYPHIEFVEGFIEDLPFADSSFDTVVCTHTLEHVQDIFTAIKELRRVARQRLIIVVPKQRPYKYTFDFHLHFFPYEHSLLNLIGPGYKNACETVGGDLFYIEDIV